MINWSDIFEQKFWPKVRFVLLPIKDVLKHLKKDGSNFDDLGNEIGIILGKFLKENDKFDLNDFIDLVSFESFKSS